ncbi:BZ3500_MvSof-1268-A1-R1_Chr6-2g08426 [Microbotryum saponariae]|uniref:BZ3500_MvSof-1268-A1-R1_Chr6-2g08426 protein n=1 Tax=Microbotryum saponariae TaxID=289078 RepID=A0A2X0M6K8_9BASI|nr:BZ3500_MvSof-1268-A1-R1_Chr6-2g08426 [Microbotryum saponariae]SDA07703.1 BZ3501_MvSof-1269-A2-R1_Chr6-1g08140 [Microbotryum saponariae]
MDEDLRAYIFSKGLLLPPDDYLALLLEPVVVELQAPLPSSEAIDEDDIRSIEFWDQRRWDGWMKGVEREVWEDKLEVKAEVMQRIKGVVREVKRGRWSKMGELSELMEDKEHDQVFRFPNRLEDAYLLSRVARRRGAFFESEFALKDMIDNRIISPDLLEVEDDDELLRMLDMPEIEDGLAYLKVSVMIHSDLRLPTTAEQVAFLKEMTRSIKATGRLTTGQLLTESDEAEGHRPSRLDIDTFRMPSPPLLPRATSKLNESSRLDLFDELDVITPPSSPRGSGVPMNAWNREEDIRSLPSSPVRFSREASSRPIWSSPPTSDQPEKVSEWMEIDKPLFPRAEREGAATLVDVEMPPVPFDSSLLDSDDEPIKEVLTPTNPPVSELLASDDTIGPAEQLAPHDLTKLRLRGKPDKNLTRCFHPNSQDSEYFAVPHLSNPTFAPPPPPPTPTDFASTSSSAWSLKLDRELTSATIGLSWAVDRQVDGLKLDSIMFDDDSKKVGLSDDPQERGGALLVQTMETDDELAELMLDDTSQVEFKTGDTLNEFLLQPRASTTASQSHPTLSEQAHAQSTSSSTNRFTEITASDLDMSKIPPDLIQAVKSTTSSSSPLSRLLSPGLESNNPASESRSSPPPSQEPGSAGLSSKRVEDDSGLKDIVMSRLGRLQEASVVPEFTSRRAAIDQFLSTRGRQISRPVAVPKTKAGQREATQTPDITPLPVPQPPQSPPYQDTPFPKPQFLQVDDETLPVGHLRVIGFHSLFQNRLLRSALEEVNIELIHRYSRWVQDRYRTLDPHLILNSHTCVVFRPLWSLVGRAYRAEEVDNTSTSTDLTRPEAFFTTLYRLSHRFDRILVVLTERWPKTSTTANEYTPPVLKALRELDQGILEHLTGSDDRVHIQVVFSRSPEESGKIVRKLLIDLRHSDLDVGSDSREWLDDPSEEERLLLQIDTINEYMASRILSQCSANEFFQLDETTREAGFAGIIGAERMIEVERSIQELQLRQDPASRRADDAAPTLTGIGGFEAYGSMPSEASLTSFQELIFDVDA